MSFSVISCWLLQDFFLTFYASYFKFWAICAHLTNVCGILKMQSVSLSKHFFSPLNALQIWFSFLSCVYVEICRHEINKARLTETWLQKSKPLDGANVKNFPSRNVKWAQTTKSCLNHLKIEWSLRKNQCSFARFVIWIWRARELSLKKWEEKKDFHVAPS